MDHRNSSGNQPEAFRVEELTISRIPGIRREYSLKEISPGINLISGPNGIGKSRTALALRALFWHDSVARDSDITGNLSLDSDAWTVELGSNGPAIWRNRTRESASKFAIFARAQSDRYALSLQQLLQADNKDFVAAVLREAAGGYDLPTIYRELDIQEPGRRIRKPRVARALQDASQELRRLRAADEQLSHKEQNLIDLRQQGDDARKAGGRLENLKRWREYRTQIRDLEIATKLMEAFPSPLANMDGSELEEVNEAERQVVEIRSEIGAREIDKVHYQHELMGAGYSGTNLPSKQEILAIRALVEDLRRKEDGLNQLFQEIERLRARVDEDRRRISDTLDDDQLREAEVETIRSLAEIDVKQRELFGRIAAEEQIAEWLRVDEGRDRDSLQDAMTLLLRYVESNDLVRVGERSGSISLVLLATAALLLFVSILLAVFYSPNVLILTLCSIPIIWAAWSLRSIRYQEDLSSIKSEFVWQAIPPPESWEIPTVRHRIRELRTEIAQAEIEYERQNRWREREEYRSRLEDQKRKFETERNEAQRALSIQRDDSVGELLTRLANALENWRRHYDELISAESNARELRRQRTTISERLASEFKSVGSDIPVFDSAAAAREISTIEERVEKAGNAIQEVSHTEYILTNNLYPRLERVQARIAELFSLADIGNQNHGELGYLCQQYPMFLDAQKEVGRLESIVRDRELQLLPDHEIEHMSDEVLDSEIFRLQELSNQRENIQAQITEIKKEVEQASQATRIEEMLAKRIELLGELDVERQRVEEQEARALIYAFLQEQDRTHNRPPVFELAAQLFATFTNGRYELDLDRQSQEFVAVESGDRRLVELDQLSSGTRIQLLLAVRLAFIESMEDGVKLPLIMDEVLGNSDDQRSRAIIEATAKIVGAGRQVFYFTAQTDEVSKWKTTLEGLEDPLPWKHFDLEQVRGFEFRHSGEIEPWTPTVFKKYTVTGSETEQELFHYLEVRPLDLLRDRPGEYDLWYVLSDPEIVSELRNRGVRSWGPYQNLYGSRGIDGVIDEARSLTMRARVSALEAFIDAWRIGRPVPFSQADLSTSGFITSRFWNEVVECAERSHWDGRALIESLRNGKVRNFRKTVIDDLANWMLDQGLITEEEPLSAEEIRARMIARVNAEIQNSIITISDINGLIGQVTNIQAASES